MELKRVTCVFWTNIANRRMTVWASTNLYRSICNHISGQNQCNRSKIPFLLANRLLTKVIVFLLCLEISWRSFIKFLSKSFQLLLMLIIAKSCNCSFDSWEKENLLSIDQTFWIINALVESANSWSQLILYKKIFWSHAWLHFSCWFKILKCISEGQLPRSNLSETLQWKIYPIFSIYSSWF